jgi:hypothetical protein
VPIKVTFNKGIVDADTTLPMLKSDADAAVAVISSTGRFYWMSEGDMYYVDGTKYTPAAPTGLEGIPIGVLVGITYPTDSG